MNTVYQELGPCPCGPDLAMLDETARRVEQALPGCGVVGTKLTRYGHLVGCKCRHCQGRRSKRKGQKAQARMHKRLGGEGWTPTHEEAARPYTVEVSVMPESKTGGQIPASFDRFISSEWFRRALSQSERAVPVGTGVLPCVVIRGDFAIVDIRRKGKP